MSKRPGIAQCGLGQWGPNLLRNAVQNSNCEVVALCDNDPARLRQFGENLPKARLYKTIDEVANDPAVDAVILATPAGFHAEHTRQLLEAGKDVLVEKPLSMEMESARELVKLAKSRGRILMVGHTFLFNPAVIKVKEHLDAGLLGKLQLIQAQRMSLGRVRTDCNALWNLAPHDVSILLYWIGKMPLRVSAHGLAFHERHSQEDFAFCYLEFPDRVVASIQVSWLNPVKIRHMTLVGSERMLIYDDVKTENLLTLYHQRVEEVAKHTPEGSLERYILEARAGKSEPLPVEFDEPLAREIAHFIECIETRRSPRGSGEEALRIIQVLDACDRSIKSNGATIELESL